MIFTNEHGVFYLKIAPSSFACLNRVKLPPLMLFMNEVINSCTLYRTPKHSYFEWMEILQNSKEKHLSDMVVTRNIECKLFFAILCLSLKPGHSRAKSNRGNIAGHSQDFSFFLKNKKFVILFYLQLSTRVGWGRVT